VEHNVDVARSSWRANQGWARGELGGKVGVELAGTGRLEKGLGEGSPDAHRLADRLHLRTERLLGTRELLKREARELDDDVVECGLEARGRRPGQVIRDLVKRVPDGQLGCDLGDRVAGRLARERRRA
jgi:hypothetical protein